MGVDLGGATALVAQELLDVPEIRAGLEEVGGEGVAEGVGGDPLGQAGGFGGPGDDPLHGAGGVVAAPVLAGEELLAAGEGLPVDPDGGQGLLGQEGVPILPALAAADPQETPVGVQVLGTESNRLADP